MTSDHLGGDFRALADLEAHLPVEAPSLSNSPRVFSARISLATELRVGVGITSHSSRPDLGQICSARLIETGGVGPREVEKWLVSPDSRF